MTEKKKPSQAAKLTAPQDETQKNTQPQLDIPWLKRWDDKDKTPPDMDFIARLEELEYK